MNQLSYQKNSFDQSSILKILIIDSDPLSLEFFANMVNLNPGMELFGKYKNIYRALENSQPSQHKNCDNHDQSIPSPDIVLCTISINDVSPLESVKKLKSTFSKAKVLFMSTAHATNNCSVLNLVKQAGGNGYVNKVQSMNTILEAIKIINCGRSYFKLNDKDDQDHNNSKDQSSDIPSFD